MRQAETVACLNTDFYAVFTDWPSNYSTAEVIHFQGKQRCQIDICIPCEKNSILNGNKSLPLGANSFLLE